MQVLAKKTSTSALEWIAKNPNIRIMEFGNEADWLEARRDYVTGSDLAVLCGRSAYKGLYRLHLQKMGVLEDISNEAEWMKAGHYLEPAISAWYADETGRTVEDPGSYTLITNTQYPGIAVTLDRGVFDRRKGPGVLEIKNRGLTTKESWREGVPESPLIQIQGQLLVTEFTWGSAAALVGGNQFYWGDVSANRRFQIALVRRVSRFWKDIREGVMPEPGDHPDDEVALDSLHPNDSGDVVSFPAEMLDVFTELQDIADQRKALDKRASQLRCRVKSALGGATYGHGPGYEFSNKSQTTKKHVKIYPRHQEHYGQIYDLLTKNHIEFEIGGGTTSRVLRMKEIK